MSTGKLTWTGLSLVCALAMALVGWAQGGSYAATWTVMVYLDGDNNLEGAGIDDVNEMEMAPDSTEVNILVQFDRVLGGDSSNGDWMETRRYQIRHDTNPSLITSPQVGGLLGELNMGDPQTLVDFAEWGIAVYPADHYLLILWDHGSGWKKGPEGKPYKSICWDDTDADYLSTAEMSSALASIRGDLGRNLDILGCDACLMQMAEIAYELRGVADYYVASEETIPWDGFPYDELLTALVNTPTMSAAELCGVMVDTYCGSYNDGSQGYDYVTLSAVDLSQIVPVAEAMDGLGMALGSAMESYCPYIISYVTAVQSYYDTDYLDAYDLGRTMLEYVPESGVTAAAEAVMPAVDLAVIANGYVGSWMANSHGLSIYYPAAAAYSPGYGDLSFAADTGWDEYISTAPPCSEMLPDAYEDDDTPEQASQITPGTPQVDHWFDMEGDQDWAKFEAQAGARYAMGTENLGAWADTVLYLYGADAVVVLASDDDSGPEYLSSLIDWQFAESGTYYLRVEHYSWLAGLATEYDLYVTQHRFADVLPGYWAFDWIESCVNAGIVGGYPNGTYRPTNPVDRGSMAVYVSRALAGGDESVPTGPATPTFSDVLADHWAYKYVEYAVDQNVVGGYPNGTYRPDLTVDRGQMAVFVARAIVTPAERPDLPSYAPPETPSFSDVATDHWAYKYIEYIVAEGIAGGYENGTYRPGNTVTRDQMAVYVTRAFGLPM